MRSNMLGIYVDLGLATKILVAHLGAKFAALMLHYRPGLIFLTDKRWDKGEQLGGGVGWR
jgi:hypothetical protein